jgi:hypothetical protein
VELDLHKNEIVGTLPASLGESTTLGKSFTDWICVARPVIGSQACLYRFSFLINNASERIDLSGNAIGGTVPTVWASLPNLVSLMLQQNELTGSIPIGDGWRKLRDLWLNGNSLQGTIPDGMGQLTDLMDIILEDNVSYVCLLPQ